MANIKETNNDLNIKVKRKYNKVSIEDKIAALQAKEKKYKLTFLDDNDNVKSINYYISLKHIADCLCISIPTAYRAVCRGRGLKQYKNVLFSENT